MSCFFCEEKIIDATTTYMVDVKNKVYVIKNVPCRRCEHCGEDSFSYDIAVELESIMVKLKKVTRRIHIYDYRKQAMVALSPNNLGRHDIAI